MAASNVKLIDANRNTVATARVTEAGGAFTGTVDLSAMPASLRQTFEDYEELVNDQVFSALDEIEEQINKWAIRVLLEGAAEAVVSDLQVYPSTRQISFKVARASAAHDTTAA